MFKSKNIIKPKRTFLGIIIRYFIDNLTKKFPLPKINPNKVSGLSVIFSITFVLTFGYSKIISFLFLFLVIFCDFLDGAISKRYYKKNIEGYIVDVTSDRISEGIIFSFFFFPWFYLFTLNIFLTIWSFLNKKHIILPLRQIFIIYFGFFVL